MMTSSNNKNQQLRSLTEESEFDKEESSEFMADEESNGHNRHDGVCQVKKMDWEAAKKVWIWKVVVMLVIVVTATLVSAGSYVFLQQKEDEDYQDGYMQMVDTIRDAVEFHSTNILTALNVFTNTITATAIGQNEQFPFVTLPNFEAIASGVRMQTGAEMINWHVMVNKSQLEDWRVYTAAHVHAHQEEQRATALAINMSSILASDFVDGEMYPYPYIPQFEGDKILPGKRTLAPEYGDGPYFPAWMVSPPPFTFDFFNSDPYPWALKSQLGAVLERRATIFCDLGPMRNLAGRAIKPDDHEAFHKSLIQYESKDPDDVYSSFDHPHLSVMVPVFEGLNDPTSRLAGSFIVLFPWDRFMVDLLPEGVHGITCVLRSTCNRTFTYLLDGNSAFYVGEGDHHDPAYDDTEVIIPFGYFPPGYQPVNGECLYSYYIYGTHYFEDQYRSNLPWALTVVVAMTFAVMIATFIIYDVFVTSRNRQAVGVATKTNAIVSNLFPEQVRDRLMEEAAQKQKRAKDNSSSNSNKLQMFLSGEFHESTTHAGGGPAASSSPPIADLYEECTVYFADIAGFTQWSSSRQPVEVFTLLEALYKEFDDAAKQRGVFKVETIGDCYVAITGLPKPRKTHAVVMARFAGDTRDRMRVVTTALVETLGADTRDLDLRIGLHSGAVTAGVLRGEKSRFQLFGDTVNTAARMESNSKRGKIQVSEATATRIRQAGKAMWLTAREELVEAKGKGSMQTYWVEPSTGTGLTMTSYDPSERGDEQEPFFTSSSMPVMDSTNNASVDHHDIEEVHTASDKKARVATENILPSAFDDEVST